MPDVNKSAIQEWVDALRSGNFKQTQGTLSKEGAYCCLGVACEIFADRVGLIRRPGMDLRDQAIVVGYSYPTSVGATRTGFDELPPPVVDFLGIESSNPWMDNDGLPESLTIMNDEWGWDFQRIADAIEATYLKGVPRFSGESEDTGERRSNEKLLS